MFGCSSKTRTVENLKSAINAETAAALSYSQYAQIAAQDSLYNIEALFLAASASEDIHAKNLLARYNELTNEKYLSENSPSGVDGTVKNLYNAKAVEEYEVMSVYPEMIEIATAENATAESKLFNGIMITEERHADYYVESIEALQRDGADVEVCNEWVVCPKCGDTYKKCDAPQNCELCGASSKSFIVFSGRKA